MSPAMGMAPVAPVAVKCVHRRDRAGQGRVDAVTRRKIVPLLPIVVP
jgi:hypothetical protein